MLVLKENEQELREGCPRCESMGSFQDQVFQEQWKKIDRLVKIITKLSIVVGFIVLGVVTWGVFFSSYPALIPLLTVLIYMFLGGYFLDDPFIAKGYLVFYILVNATCLMIISLQNCLK